MRQLGVPKSSSFFSCVEHSYGTPRLAESRKNNVCDVLILAGYLSNHVSLLHSRFLDHLGFTKGVRACVKRKVHR